MTSSSRISASLVALALGFAGCGGEDPALLGQTAQEIIGGSSDAADPAVVLVFAQQPRSAQGFLCSGTVIAPRVVVTAAHCLSPQTIGTGNTFQVFFGSDWNKATTTSWAAVKEVHFDPAFDARNLGAGHDIGVVILAQPTSVKPVPRYRGSWNPSMVGQPVRLAGFGVSDGKTQGGVGIKRSVSTRLDDYNGLLLHVGDSEHQSCEGDSGGPALMTIAGVETLVGVTSFGQVGCVGGGWHTRVDVLAAFIDTYAPAPSAPKPPVPTRAPRTLPRAM